MTPVKIIFFDIDGTLVDPQTGRISEKSRQALRQLEANGIRRCIVTGRSPASLPDFGDLRFDAMSTFNGSCCYTDADVIHSNPIAPDDVEIVMRNAASLGRPVAIATRSRLAANGLDPDLADYYGLAGLELTVAPDFDALCREDVYQLLVGCRPADHPALIRDTHNVKLAVSWERAVDVIPSSSGKGIAIAKILAHFGLTASEAMAFGDSYNDLDMLQAVGCGVAMGNAPEQLKAVARDVCACVSEDGIYHYCLEHGLL